MACIMKLRIAVADGPMALQLATGRVSSAIGLDAQPDFQEVDRTELIVELSIAEAHNRRPGDIARAVEREAGDMDVLSSWLDSGSGAGSRRLQSVFTYPLPGDKATVPYPARRALTDQLPTTAWQPAGDNGPHWLLAVPVVGHDGRLITAVVRRQGYSHRFAALDARSLQAQLGRAVA